MRPDPDACRDPDLLAAEVRRLRAVIAAREPKLTDAEREAIEVAAAAYAEDHGERFATILRSLLERLSTR
jgi:hypothetical protein